MVEAIRHTLGVCGEHWHPSIWTVIASSPAVASAIYYIKYTYKNRFNKQKIK
jgi:hypothetical protein